MGNSIVFRGMILRPDGSEVHETTCKGAVQDGPLLGAAAARELKGRAAPGFFAAA
jgi:hydroxymethylbilane synthase